MVHILKRMHKLHELLWIRCGPGALILPKEVTKLSLEFHPKLQGGHRGARKFFKEMLPRIKYRNPSIPIEVIRKPKPEDPSALHIFTRATTTSSTSTSNPAPSSNSATASPSTDSATRTIDIRDKDESEILAALIEATRAEQLEPTEQEIAEMREIKESNERRERDRVEVREKLQKKRREEEMMRVARGEV